MTSFDLLSKIKKARFPDAKIAYYSRTVRVLAIDELRYVYHDKGGTDLLYHVISGRSELASKIVTTVRFFAHEYVNRLLDEASR
jgi:DNA replication protein DnaC